MDRNALEAIGLDFEIRLYETAVALGRASTEVLVELAQAYSRAGRHDDGHAIDRQLVARDPKNPTFHYNLACSACLSGAVDFAFHALETALELGFDDYKLLLEDRDLRALRDDRRWEAIVRRLG